MIDAREAAGVPCITSCPQLIPRAVMDALDLDLTDWQARLLRGWGFAVAH